MAQSSLRLVEDKAVDKTKALDAALSQIYRSPALPELYNRWFAALGRPAPVLEVMFGLGRLPE